MDNLKRIEFTAEHLIWCLNNPDKVVTVSPTMSLADHIIFNAKEILTLAGEL